MEKNQSPREKVLAQVKVLREERGYTPEQMAAALDISTTNYLRIEAAKFAVNIDMLTQIAKILDAEIRITKREG